ncbi:UvrD-helicase domain-containing protein [Escherichia coli]
MLAGAGSGKTSVLVARAGWLLTRGEASPEPFYCWRLAQSR